MANPNISRQQQEAAMRRYGHQTVEPGFSGAGYWWNGYPTYVGGAGILAPEATMPGSNVEAAMASATSGLGDGGTAGY